MNNEILFVGTADAEHAETYLNVIWRIKEFFGFIWDLVTGN